MKSYYDSENLKEDVWVSGGKKKKKKKWKSGNIGSFKLFLIFILLLFRKVIKIPDKKAAQSSPGWGQDYLGFTAEASGKITCWIF